MGDIICISSNKGGVAKTTTAINLAADYSRRGFRTLLIDMDPQCSVNEYLGISIRHNDPSVINALKNPYTGIPVYRIRPNLDICPCSEEGNNAEEMFHSRDDKFFLLRNAINGVRLVYDKIVVDTPPYLGILTTNALFAADYLLMPMEPALSAYKGIERIGNLQTEIRKYGWNIAALGVVLTKFDRLTISREVEEMVAKRESPDSQGTLNFLFHTKIRSYKVYRESACLGKDIFSYALESNAALDSAALTDEIEDRIKKWQNWRR